MSQPTSITPDKPRRGAIDTLVAKDQTAVFWFLVACVTAAACAWYLVIMAEALKARPPFVVMDTAGAYYVSPGLNYNSVKPVENPMHKVLTDLAVRTLFERGPEGLMNDARLEKLCDRDGLAAMRGIINKEDADFRRQQIQQTVSIQARSIEVAMPTALRTVASGIVTRRGTFNGSDIIERFNFEIRFIWKMNPDMRKFPLYPSVINGVPTYKLEKITDDL
ncbi:MAG: hypothetical protein CJBNEKGG_00138 [Prosthecobacter sp.]|jgi:hypothetical protein|nr:hypothetical protein [Prosthecobacter sp.]